MSGREGLYYTAPSNLPYVSPEMKTAGFWISRHLSVDEIIMDQDGIRRFNAYTRDELKLVTDLTEIPAVYPGNELKNALAAKLNEFTVTGYYVADGQKVPETFFEQVRRNSNLEAVPAQITVQYGLVVRYAHQRFFPTPEGLYAKPFDIDFDELQNSALDIGTPVLVLHESRDGQWVYVMADLSSGWVRADDVARADRQDWINFMEPSLFAVITSAKADIFLDENLTKHYGYVRMGVKLPLRQNFSASIKEIRIPMRMADGKLELARGFLAAEDAAEGFLPYSPRHIIRQAFKLLNEPYGWGGMYGEQDCSRFLQEVFATVGVALPRNSSAQAKTGHVLAQFNGTTVDEKMKVLADAPAGTTILPMKGHIMLYLGAVEGRPYAIHATWAYREPAGASERVRVINRVVVTDLSLGAGSKRGSLLERLHSIVIIAP